MSQQHLINQNKSEFNLILISTKNQFQWLPEELFYGGHPLTNTAYNEFLAKASPYIDEFGVHNYHVGFRYNSYATHELCTKHDNAIKQTRREKHKKYVQPRIPLDWSILLDPEFAPLLERVVIGSERKTSEFIPAQSNGKTLKNQTRVFTRTPSANRHMPPRDEKFNEGASTSQLQKTEIPDIKVNIKDLDLTDDSSSTASSLNGSIANLSDFTNEVLQLVGQLDGVKPFQTVPVGQDIIEVVMKQGLFPSLGTERTFLVSVTISTVTSIGTSIATFYTTQMTTAMKAAHVANLTSQLVTFCLTLKVSFDKLKTEFFIDKARQFCPVLANLILGEVKANNDSWIYTALSSLISIIIGGLTSFKLIDVKSIIDGGRWLQSLKQYQTAGKEMMDILLDDLCHLDIKGDARSFELIQKLALRTSELKSMSYYHFLSNPPLMKELKELTTNVIDTTMRSMKNIQLSKAALAGQRIILTNHDSLLDTHKMLQSILETRKRQECVGVLLAGEPNVGKSHLTSYIATKVSTILKYQKGVYSIDKSCKGEYFQPYGLQDIGVQEEFMAQRSNDETLSYINKIISGDPYNLEGADLNLKQQPCRLKLMMLTANNICPTLTGVLGSSYAEGVWDRILRVDVIDPNLVGRGAEAPHRRPDFSHLRFRIVTNARCLTPSNLKYADLTINQLINMIINRLIKAELNFIEVSREYEYIQPQDLLHVDQRKYELEQIQNRLISANAGQYNVIRVQGPPETGKTIFAMDLASKFTSAFPTFKIAQVPDFQLTPKTDKTIYIVDDILEDTQESYTAYLRWINNLSQTSLVIIITNVEIKRLKYSEGIIDKLTTKVYNWVNSIPDQQTYCYEVDTNGVSSGIVRRIGIPGIVRYSTRSGKLKYTSNSNLSQQCISVENYGTTWTLQGITMNQGDICNAVIRTMAASLNTQYEVRVVHGLAGRIDQEPACSIICKNLAIGAETFSSMKNMLLSLVNYNPDVSVKLEPEFVQKIHRTYAQATTLLQQADYSTKEKRKEVIYNFAILMNKASPGVYLRMELKEEQEIYTLYDNILYVPENHGEINFIHTLTDISFYYNNEFYTVPIQRVAALHSGENPLDLSYLDPVVLGSLNRYYWNFIHKEDKIYMNWIKTIQQEHAMIKERGILHFLKHHWIITLITGVTSIVLIKKVLTSLLSTTGHSNNSTVYDKDTEIEHLTKRFRAALFNQNPEAEIKSIRQQAKDEGLDKQFNDYEFRARSNALQPLDEQYKQQLSGVHEMIYTAIEEKDHAQILQYMKSFPKLCMEYLASKQHVKSNMLTATETDHQIPSAVAMLSMKLKRNYVRVTKRRQTTMNCVYGLVVGRHVVTVSHLFEQEGEPVSIDSDGKNYTGRVIRIERQEDRAFIEITDRTFPAAPDIKNMFTNVNEISKQSDAWFIKPTEHTLMYKGNMKHIPYTHIPIKDMNNKLYHLDQNFIEFSVLSMKGVSEVFALGDCGLPLVAKINNEFKIIALHNGLSASQVSWFTTITSENFKDLGNKALANSYSPAFNSPLVAVTNPISKTVFNVDKLTSSKLNSESKASYFDNPDNKLSVIGFYPSLKFNSNYKHKKVYNSTPEKYLECLTARAPLTSKDVTDTSKLKIDLRGNYDPLYAQACKYAEKTASYGKWDTEIRDWTMHLIKQYYNLNYNDNDYRKLKPHEVLNPWKHLKGLDMSTSAGPKLKMMDINSKRPKENPNVLFTNANEGQDKPPFYHFSKTKEGEILKQDYMYYMRSIEEGVPVLVVSQDCRKVELLPIEKATYKLRLFNSIDLSINMLLKSYFGHHLNEIISKKDECLYVIGQNPYADATTHMRSFNSMQGYYQNADFSALDKSIPREMIQWFVECLFQDTITEKEKNALYETLTFCLHNLDGHIYGVSGGNESGSYVTTLLNVFVVHFTSWYTTIRLYKERNGELPNLQTVEKLLISIIMGDDCVRKFRKDFLVTFKDLEIDAALFNLTQTEPKGEGEISFCSRTYIHIKDEIYAPVLKKSSITSCLFWLSSTDKEQVSQNCHVALLESALFTFMEKQEGKTSDFLFDNVVKTVYAYAKQYQLAIDLFPYEKYIEGYINYVRMYAASPFYKDKGETQLSIQSNKFTPLNSLPDIKEINEIILKNSVSNMMRKDNVERADCRFNEHLQKDDIREYSVSYKATQWNETPRWTVEVSARPNGPQRPLFKGIATEPTKKEAYKQACFNYFEAKGARKPKEDIIITLAELHLDDGESEEEESVNPFQQKPERELLKPICITATSNQQTRFIEREEDEDQNTWIQYDKEHIANTTPEQRSKILDGMNKALHKRLRHQAKTTTGEILASFAIYEVKGKYKYSFKFTHPATSNTLNNVEPSGMNVAAQGMMTSDLPVGRNAQPTAVVPTMTSPGEPIMGSVEQNQISQLNPIGTPNMLAFGGILFDIKTLIYKTPLDADIELEVTDDIESGSIIAQIPYGVNTPFVNRYIVAYARLHERYSGALTFRVTCIGNATFSGAVGMAWYPRGITTSIFRISELQKYASDAKGVTLPWTNEQVLHDGRQNLFYRKTNEIVDADRPHLIIFLFMSIQSSLREGIRTRIRIASKLNNATEANPFQFSNPELDLAFPDIGPATNTTGSILTPFTTLFPQTNNKQLFVYTDGVYASGEEFEGDIPVFDVTTTDYHLYGNNGGLNTNPALTISSVWSDRTFGTDWPSYNTIYANTTGVTSTAMSTVITTTMSSKDTMEFTSCLPQPWGTGGGDIKESDWNRFRTNNSFDRNRILDFGFQIHSVTGSDTRYNMPGTSITPVRYHTAVGWRKVITQRGVYIIHLIAHGFGNTTNNRGVVHEAGNSGTQPYPNLPNNLPIKPYLLIEEQFYFSNTSANALPPGFRKIQFTNMAPTAVAIDGFLYSTASQEPIMKKWFQERTQGLSITQCLQFRLIDRISTRAIATVRYLQELNCFVINSAEVETYKVLRTDVKNIDITTPTVTQRTLDFPISNTLEWISRSSNTYLGAREIFKTTPEQEEAIMEYRQKRYIPVSFSAELINNSTSNMEVYEYITPEGKAKILLHPNVRPVVRKTLVPTTDKNSPPYVSAPNFIKTNLTQRDYFKPIERLGTSNAMVAAIAAGALSGVGSGIQQGQNRKHELQLQANQFDFTKYLQQANQGFQKDMQGNQHKQESLLQSNTHQQQSKMQENAYQNDLGLLQSSHQEQRETDANRTQLQGQTDAHRSQLKMTEKGLSSRTFNLPGLNGATHA